MTEKVYTQDEFDAAVDNARRLERVHQALNLWSMVENSDAGPKDDEQRAMDSAYLNAAAWLLADVSRWPNAGDNARCDLVTDAVGEGLAGYPKLIEAATPRTRTIVGEQTGEVDRAVAAATQARAVAAPKES